ncbi:hypothetical protein PUN28_016248 [Cardiocondyla obscurior]|uniref:Uncharacterized protein n=1 Tax=Cardiocondyla obscurior TaxID=286306 RepID=A0AAW2ERM8_9HYME
MYLTRAIKYPLPATSGLRYRHGNRFHFAELLFFARSSIRGRRFSAPYTPGRRALLCPSRRSDLSIIDNTWRPSSHGRIFAALCEKVPGFICIMLTRLTLTFGAEKMISLAKNAKL